MFKTYSKKASEVQHKWVLIDAAGVPVGRLATFAATRLIGKYQPTYTPHIDSGDNVVVINADKAWLTGDKYKTKQYYSYSGYPSGIKSKTAKEIGKSAAIESAVKGMLPKNKLQTARFLRLRVFKDENHSHAAQSPTPLAIAKKQSSQQGDK
ncbi:MAG: 50S ribosomal protein L13 [Candidatus Nomurabacteria bacterium]|jgi:large subunit ribosomal protein L13|nr:50S ribosomal protein L13 [Candidatus Nomurabacteria bacterium]